MWVDLKFFLEIVSRVNAAAEQYLKRAGKRVLVNTGRTIKPIISVYEKSGPDVKRDWWIPEVGGQVHLLGQLSTAMNPTDDVPWINARREFRVRESARGDRRESLFAVILFPPGALNQSTKFGERSHASPPMGLFFGRKLLWIAPIALDRPARQRTYAPVGERKVKIN